MVTKQRLQEDTPPPLSTGLRQSIWSVLKMYILPLPKSLLSTNSWHCYGVSSFTRVCNLYLGDFEYRALDIGEHTTWWWKCYVDNTHTILRKAHAQQLMDRLSSGWWYQVDYRGTGPDTVDWWRDGECSSTEKVEKSLVILDKCCFFFVFFSLPTTILPLFQSIHKCVSFPYTVSNLVIMWWLLNWSSIIPLNQPNHLIEQLQSIVTHQQMCCRAVCSYHDHTCLISRELAKPYTL